MRHVNRSALPVPTSREAWLLIPSFSRVLAVLVVALVFLAGCGDSTKSDQPSDDERAPRPDGVAGGASASKRAQRSEATQPIEARHVPDASPLIQQHHELIRSGKKPTARQCRLFADAYYEVGVELVRKGKRAEAEPYFREALRLWPKHARATLRRGDIFAVRRQFKPAAQAYERAGKLDVALQRTVRKRRTRLVELVLAIADQRLADCEVAGARQVLEFVQRYLEDVGGDEARKRLKKLEPLLRAEVLLGEARQEIARHPKTEGYKKLRQVATDFPRTYFAQEANRLLEANGRKIVLHDTATGYKLPLHWRRTTTEHFEIYYEKQRALTGAKRHAEEAFRKIVADFGMDDIEWKTRITMYLFSDDEEWQAFLRMNRDKTMEWAGGFALPWANEIYVYVSDEKKYLYKRLVPHELTHVLHYRYVGGIYQPLCITEGLARFQEKGGVKEAREAIDELVKRGEAFELEELFKLSYYPPQAISLFYAQSATLVGFMIDEYGLDKFKEFMFAFASTRDAAETIGSVYGISLDIFGKKWEKYVR